MMKEPDPTDDLDRTILETFDEMHAEAQVTPIFLTFPPKVIESVRAYAKEHSLEPGNDLGIFCGRPYSQRGWRIANLRRGCGDG